MEDVAGQLDDAKESLNQWFTKVQTIFYKVMLLFLLSLHSSCSIINQFQWLDSFTFQNKVIWGKVFWYKPNSSLNKRKLLYKQIVDSSIDNIYLFITSS